ncbi:citrate lyase subunit beta/citryl-CoA lyase [Rhizobium wenxiniae]|uniref:Citrate lyase subunit beta/citryl-CoA lyase n=1 Tax=Rhizobium wenxiniae TaxID=1737357 RepID=A0A7W9YB93_9HYPH|nr:CoA ester lyase [Rhizobium wenxiniae]MBB6165419.1 citrate lyase subunit beta/citryl-CoA lyase [Rhizobium wenxiniae]
MKNHIAPVRRSLLSVPADNRRALEKAPGLDCDGLIYDLEDSVAPEKKPEARDNLANAFSQPCQSQQEQIIRINPLESGFGEDDLKLAAQILPDAVALPKVEHVGEIAAVADMLARLAPARSIALWAMIETPKGVLNAASIAAAENGPKCLVVGSNDLRKETGVLAQPGRAYLVPWLMQIVLAGRAHGVDVIDSVFNDFRDDAGFAAECAQGRAMGFSGKMLIHPAQIDIANRHFGPDPQAVSDAEAIVSAFEQPEAQGLNVINLDGKMIERLHFEEAKTLLAQAAMIFARKKPQ